MSKIIIIELTIQINIKYDVHISIIVFYHSKFNNCNFNQFLFVFYFPNNSFKFSRNIFYID